MLTVDGTLYGSDNDSIKVFRNIPKGIIYKDNGICIIYIHESGFCFFDA